MWGGGTFLPPLRRMERNERRDGVQMRYTTSLKENHIFRRLYARGKSAVTPTLAAYVRRNRSGQTRLGLTVGTKVGKAVRRNKVRRRMRAAYQLHESQMTPGWDIVIVARVRAAYAPYAELERDLLRLMDKLGVRQKREERT